MANEYDAINETYIAIGAAIKKSKAYTDSEVAKVRTKFQVVASYADLPDPGRTDTIYLVPKTGHPGVYDQYIYDGTQYVDIGDTEIDLAEYVTDVEFDNRLAPIEDISQSFTIENGKLCYIPSSEEIQDGNDSANQPIALDDTLKDLVDAVEEIADNIGTVAEATVMEYCADNFSEWSGALDSTLTQPLMAAPADKVGELNSALTTFLIDEERAVVAQLYDKTTNTADKYVSYTDGNLYTNNTFNASDFIEIDPLKVYKIYPTSTQMAMYNASKQYVDGYAAASSFNAASEAGTIPTTVKYIRFSVPNNMVDSAYVNEYGIVRSYNETFKNEVKSLINIVNEHIVTVGSGGDYANLKACFSAIEPDENNHYTVKLLAGTYDLRQLYTAEEIADATFYGMFIPNYVSLVGVSGAENTIITWDGSGDASQNRISTLQCYNWAEIEGVTIKGKNVRYVFHDDFATSGQYNYRRIRNCVFDSTEVTLNHLVGNGEKGNSDWVYENCVFKTNIANNAYIQHNNTNVSLTSYLKFKNCRFIGPSNACVILSSLNNGTTALVHTTFEGCKLANPNNLDAKLVLNENGAVSYGAGIKFKVNGFYNKLAEVVINNTDGADYSSYIDLI